VLSLAARRPSPNDGSDDPALPPPTDQARPTADANR
jgi:hypothetical protein